MKQPAALLWSAVLAVAIATMAGCQSGVVGPSLSADIQNVRLQPTVAGLVGGENVCCCHIVGELRNTSSIAVDAELLFPAKAPDGQPLGTGLNIQTNVPPGGSRVFLAVGITAACKDVRLSQVVADSEIRLKGLFQPPP